jgi:hypothetical protein
MRFTMINHARMESVMFALNALVLRIRRNISPILSFDEENKNSVLKELQRRLVNTRAVILVSVVQRNGSQTIQKNERLIEQ